MEKEKFKQAERLHNRIESLKNMILTYDAIKTHRGIMLEAIEQPEDKLKPKIAPLYLHDDTDPDSLRSLINEALNYKIKELREKIEKLEKEFNEL